MGRGPGKKAWKLRKKFATATSRAKQPHCFFDMKARDVNNSHSIALVCRKAGVAFVPLQTVGYERIVIFGKGRKLIACLFCSLTLLFLGVFCAESCSVLSRVTVIQHEYSAAESKSQLLKASLSSKCF